MYRQSLDSIAPWLYSTGTILPTNSIEASPLASCAIHWFRNDLRVFDNTALTHAASKASQLIPIFILDPRLLDTAGRPRIRFLLESLRRLDAELRSRGSTLVVRHGDPVVQIPNLIEDANAELLTFNRDYSPYARRRDETIAAAARRARVTVADCKDRVVFESHELRTTSGAAAFSRNDVRRCSCGAAHRRHRPLRSRACRGEERKCEKSKTRKGRMRP